MYNYIILNARVYLIYTSCYWEINVLDPELRIISIDFTTMRVFYYNFCICHRLFEQLKCSTYIVRVVSGGILNPTGDYNGGVGDNFTNALLISLIKITMIAR